LDTYKQTNTILKILLCLGEHLGALEVVISMNCNFQQHVAIISLMAVYIYVSNFEPAEAAMWDWKETKIAAKIAQTQARQDPSAHCFHPR
jgi:hypothetical protein